jgi:hypothetical protein
MIKQSLLVILFTISLVAQVAPVTISESRDVVSASSLSGAITLPAVHLELDFSYPHGKKDRRNLSIVYDPQSRHYLWHLSTSPVPVVKGTFLDLTNSQREVLYADSAGLFAFLFSAELWVKVYTLQADSLDAAKSASIAQLQQGLAALEAGYQPRTGPSMPAWPWDYKPINLGKALPAEFSCSSLRANCQGSLNTIASVGKQGNNWRLVLRNRWEEEVILDQNFNLISEKQLTQPKQ